MELFYFLQEIASNGKDQGKQLMVLAPNGIQEVVGSIPISSTI
jgi:hypothetical protein